MERIIIVVLALGLMAAAAGVVILGIEVGNLQEEIGHIHTDLHEHLEHHGH